jgi:Zn-dependent protease
LNDQSLISLRVLGFPVSMGISFPIFMAFLGWASRFDLAEIVIWVVLGTLAILVHELGHAVVMRRFGLESTIRFWMLGGLAVPVDQEAAAGLSNRRWIAIGLAGPAVGLVLGAIGLVLVAALDPHGPIRFTLVIWVFVNLGWGIFNLLPIAALDGGQILQHMTLGLLGERGQAVAALVAIAASAGVALLAYEAGFVYVAIIAVAFGMANPSLYRDLRDGLFRRHESRPIVKPEESAGP